MTRRDCDSSLEVSKLEKYYNTEVLGEFYFFFFKQKTAYEFLTCDWGSDVCSSVLFFFGS